MMPNDTDLSVFKEAGLSGLNFAFYDGITRYDTALDSSANVDERSLQHSGSYALALTRHFGNLEFNGQKENNRIYFNLFGSVLVHYSGTWSKPLAVIALVLWGTALVYGYRKGKLELKGVLVGALTFFLSMLAAVICTTLFWNALLRLLKLQGLLLPNDNTYNAGLYMLGLVALVIAVTSSIHIGFSYKARICEWIMGVTFWWSILTILSAFLLPGTSYLFVWPLMFSLAGYIVAEVISNSVSSTRLWIHSLFAVPGLILLTPLIYSLFKAMALNWSSLLGILIVLLLGLIIPLVDFIASRVKLWLPFGSAILCLGFVITAFLTSGFDQEHPRPNSLFYALNVDNGKAVWGSLDEEPDAWTSQFIPPNSERGSLSEYVPSKYDQFLYNIAPAAQLLGSEVVVLSDAIDSGKRNIRLGIRSLRQARTLMVFLDEQTEILSAEINGKHIPGNKINGQEQTVERWGFIYSSVPQEGIQLSLSVNATGPVKIVVTDHSQELPVYLSGNYQPRTNDMMPLSSPFSDATFVSKSFIF